jgi:hypothetical protein
VQQKPRCLHVLLKNVKLIIIGPIEGVHLLLLCNLCFVGWLSLRLGSHWALNTGYSAGQHPD